LKEALKSAYFERWIATFHISRNACLDKHLSLVTKMLNTSTSERRETASEKDFAANEEEYGPTTAPDSVGEDRNLLKVY